MELGVALPTSARYASAESIVRIAEVSERLGYTSLWTYERLLYPIAGVTQPDGVKPRHGWFTYPGSDDDR